LYQALDGASELLREHIDWALAPVIPSTETLP
jgi:hypothetical protein